MAPYRRRLFPAIAAAVLCIARASAAASPAQPVTWINLVYAAASGGTLQKTGGCDGCFDAGAIASQQIAAGDGYVEFTALDATPLLLAGLSHAYTPGNPASIDFGLELGASYVQVRENGAYRADAPLSSTDVLRVAVTGGVVTYAKNGAVFYTSHAVPVYPLVAAASLANGSAAIGDAVLATATAGGPVVWTALDNTAVGANALQKAGGCDGCYDASATSVQAVGGLGYAEFTFGDSASVALVGLASAFDGTPASVDFSIRTQNGDAEVRERGVYRTDVPFSAGDVFRITINSGVVTYTKNGTAFYVSAQTPAASMIVAAALASLSATIVDAVASNGAVTGPPITDSFTTSDGLQLGVQTLVTNVEIPWSLAFTPDGRLFFTERPGRVRAYANGQLLPAPALVVDDVYPVGEGGALGLAVHPQFAVNHFVYLFYTAQTASGSVNRLMRYRESNNTLIEGTLLLDGVAAFDHHDAGRLRFGPDGKLYVTTGDAADPNSSQNPSSLSGKILRLNDDGTIPPDNPFGTAVWTLGHRDPQGIDWDPVTGLMWGSEHGDIGNDEINLLRAGHNYGWPIIEGAQTQTGMDAPVAFFSPSIAPSGASFYTGSLMAGLTGNLFVACLRGSEIVRVILNPQNRTQILATESWLLNHFGRIRDIVTGPDGALYFATNNRDGRGSPVATDDRIFRIVPLQ